MQLASFVCVFLLALHASVCVSANSHHSVHFTAYCPHKAHHEPANPELANCGNQAAVHFWLENEGPGDEVTEFDIEVSDIGGLLVSPAHIFVEHGTPQKRWLSSLMGTHSEEIHHLDRHGLFAFNHYKLAKSKDEFEHAFQHSLKADKVAFLLKECHTTDLKCFFTFPKGDHAIKAHKVHTTPKSSFLAIPHQPPSHFEPVNPYKASDAELDHVPSHTESSTSSTASRIKKVLDETNHHHLSPNVEVHTDTRDPTPASSSPSSSEYFTVPTNTHTGRWNCGGLPYHPKYQACCPGPAVVPLGERCP